MTAEEAANTLLEMGEKAFHGRQVFKWIGRGVFGFDKMTDLPLSLRSSLADCGIPAITSSPDKLLRGDDGTLKLRVRLKDGAAVEAVLLEDAAGRRTACLSSQEGCPLACAFCKTGTLGFSRNLTAGEIAEQFLFLEKEGGALSNIVFMGMGEPLLNLEAVVKAIGILTAKEGRGLSSRRITVSTAGVCDGIYALAENGPSVRLAVSLTTADHDLRLKLMPVERANPLHELKKALAFFCKRTGKRVTLEAALLKGVNTSKKHAAQIAEFCDDLNANVNLIPWNAVEGLPFERPPAQEVKRFEGFLAAFGVNAVVRYPRGGTVCGACGQLGSLAGLVDS